MTCVRSVAGYQSMAELVVALSSRLDLPPAAIPPIAVTCAHSLLCRLLVQGVL